MRIIYLAILLATLDLSGCGARPRPHQTPVTQQVPGLPEGMFRSCGLPATAYVPIPGVVRGWGLDDADFLVLTMLNPEYRDHPTAYYGFYFRSSDTLFVRARDPQHFTRDEYQILLHEMAHREDEVVHREGASVLWRILCAQPGGTCWMTHGGVNAVVYPALGVDAQWEEDDKVIRSLMGHRLGSFHQQSTEVSDD